MFVGREDIISAVTEKHAAIGQRHERVALVGLAGVGKTQTAIEYSHRVRESAPGMWVFWIHASNAARLEEGYQRVAGVAEIPGRDDPKMNVLQLVYQWLCDERNGRWLMVLDNADDDQIFFRSDDADGRASLVTFLPQVYHGSILVTSRNGLAARNLVGIDGLVIHVQPMNEAESLSLLRMRIPDSGSPAENELALVQVLEYIPLAITQAGAYIANRSPLITVSAYLRLFRESESKRMQLLQNEDSVDLRRDPSIRYAVITTWQLSFEQIHRVRPAATDLLALMSMFDRQGIPEDLVRDDQDILDFHDALAPLLSYSLIRVEMDERQFDMHRLVQLSVRTWLQIRNELVRWQKRSRMIMARTFPTGEYENWPRCQSLLVHAKEVIKSIFNIDEADSMNVAKILSNCGWYLHLQGAYVDAETMHRRALALREKVIGSEHPYTLNSVNQLGLVLDTRGKYEEAEVVYRRALIISEKVLGLEHPGTATTANNLGYVLDSRAKYEEAEAMYRRAFFVREKLFGPESSITINSVNNLGHVLDKQGKLTMSEAMHRRGLEAREKLYGLEHPHTLTSVNNLGAVLQRQGKYEEAEEMHRQALTMLEKTVGLEHLKTATSASNVGLALDSQGKSEEAEAMHRRALEVYIKLFGHGHPLTLTSFSNLGNALDSQGKYEEAEVLHRQTLEAREKVLGSEHVDTLTNINNLGHTLQMQGKYHEAEAMHRRALGGYEKVLGLQHFSTLVSVNNIRSSLCSQGKYEEARAMDQRVVKELKRSGHLDTLYNFHVFSNSHRHGKHGRTL